MIRYASPVPAYREGGPRSYVGWPELARTLLRTVSDKFVLL